MYFRILRYLLRRTPLSMILDFIFNILFILLLLVSTPLGPQRCLGDKSTGSENIKFSKNYVWQQHPYNEYSWELNQLNPWLSACDLAGPAPTDLQGSCGPPEAPKSCPYPCARKHNFESIIAHRDLIQKYKKRKKRHDPQYVGNRNLRNSQKTPKTLRSMSMAFTSSKTFTKTKNASSAITIQCLYYLEESHKNDICGEDFGRLEYSSYSSTRENRYWFLSSLRLRHCCEHSVANALAPGKGGPLETVLNGGETCKTVLDKLMATDALASRLHCEFGEVLSRYDCSQTYSVIHNCTHCKEAYRKWVCSSLVPYFAHRGLVDLEPSKGSWNGRRLRSCRSLCQSVEQRCPYLLPGDRAPAYPTQYAGEPTFLCQDPNIPETGQQAVRALHPNSENECCFDVCSEDEPALGICADCTGRLPELGPEPHDPATAPRCELNQASGQLPQQSTRQQSRCPNKGLISILNTHLYKSQFISSDVEKESTFVNGSSGSSENSILENSQNIKAIKNTEVISPTVSGLSMSTISDSQIKTLTTILNPNSSKSIANTTSLALILSPTSIKAATSSAASTIQSSITLIYFFWFLNIHY